VADCWDDLWETDAPLHPETLTCLDLAALATVQPQAKRFIIPKLAPAGEVTLFTGAGSAGKSLLAQQLATALAAGVATLRIDLQQAPAIYLTCEDDAEQLHYRQAHICTALGVGMASLAGKLHVTSLRGELDNSLGTVDRDGAFVLAAAYHRIAELIGRTGAKLVFLDNVAHLFAGNENDRGEVTRFANALNRLAGETGAAIILLGHPPKAPAANGAPQTYSGSTAWLNAVRSQFTIEHDLETDMRTLTVGKANYARKGDAIRFLWQDWAFVHEDDLPADTAKAMAETVTASSDNKLFLVCLRERIKQRRAVSEKQCGTYAPKVFAGMVESKGVGKIRLEKAMDRLFRIDVIERAELWRGDDRKMICGLRETGKHGAGDRFPQSAEDC
jgi:RecA-family ATPase